MKIQLNESENTVEIKDGIKTQYLFLKVLMVLNLFNATIRIFSKSTADYGFIEYIWIVLGAISLVVLIMFLFKLSTIDKIPIKEIRGLEEKTIFGKHRFAFVLKNGKKRHLGNFNDPVELARARELFSKIGVAH